MTTTETTRDDGGVFERELRQKIAQEVYDFMCISGDRQERIIGIGLAHVIAPSAPSAEAMAWADSIADEVEADRATGKTRPLGEFRAELEMRRSSPDDPVRDGATLPASEPEHRAAEDDAAFVERMAPCEDEWYGDDAADFHRLIALARRATQAPADGEAFRRFVLWAMQEGSWQGRDLDGGELQDKADALGLLRRDGALFFVRPIAQPPATSPTDADIGRLISRVSAEHVSHAGELQDFVRGWLRGFGAAPIPAQAPDDGWQCAARKQPNGPDTPADCDWPFCGCDEHATKVLETLQECGWTAPVPAQVPDDVRERVAVLLWQKFALGHHEEWESEAQKAEYRLAANDVLGLLGAAPIPAQVPDDGWRAGQLAAAQLVREMGSRYGSTRMAELIMEMIPPAPPLPAQSAPPAPAAPEGGVTEAMVDIAYAAACNEMTGPNPHRDEIRAALEAAFAARQPSDGSAVEEAVREACAKIAESFAARNPAGLCHSIASAIRASRTTTGLASDSELIAPSEAIVKAARENNISHITVDRLGAAIKRVKSSAAANVTQKAVDQDLDIASDGDISWFDGWTAQEISDNARLGDRPVFLPVEKVADWLSRRRGLTSAPAEYRAKEGT